ncbi:hypothetical protein ACIPWY_09585 [Streptomyces sp. NPDC090032]|uniref:hypothetical protein n=1 Tax=unclassified Streptomyces TaxID=2593676 RepID=UPI0037199696
MHRQLGAAVFGELTGGEDERGGGEGGQQGRGHVQAGAGHRDGGAELVERVLQAGHDAEPGGGRTAAVHGQRDVTAAEPLGAPGERPDVVDPQPPRVRHPEPQLARVPGEPGAVRDHSARHEGDRVGRAEGGGDARPQGGAAVSGAVQPTDPQPEPLLVGGTHGETVTGADAQSGGEHLVQGGLGVIPAMRPAPGHEFGVLSGPFEGADGDGRVGARAPGGLHDGQFGGAGGRRPQRGPGVVRHACVRAVERGPHIAVQLPSAGGTVAP